MASEHLQRSMESIVRGGLFGVGIGNGTVKFIGLPFSHTDSIFAVIAEETGLIGSAFTVILYLLLLWRGLVISQNAADLEGKLLAGGLSVWIFMEAIMNIAVMVNLIPFTGNALPFISSGGSSLVTTLTAVGMIFSVGRVAKREGKSSEGRPYSCLLYTSDAADDLLCVDLGCRRIMKKKKKKETQPEKYVNSIERA